MNLILSTNDEAALESKLGTAQRREDGLLIYQGMDEGHVLAMIQRAFVVRGFRTLTVELTLPDVIERIRHPSVEDQIRAFNGSNACGEIYLDQ